MDSEQGPGPDPELGKYQVVVSIDDLTAGEVVELERKARTIALVGLGYLAEV